MSCPDIYINPTYWTTPHAAEYHNTAIDVGSSGTNFERGVNRTIRVTVRNHGTDDSPNSRLELFWADPSTSFTMATQIDVTKFGIVPGGDGLTVDGDWPENFSWTPNATAVGTNGGHVCLLAQVGNEASPADMACSPQSHLAFSSAAIDARSAIRNIHVSNPPKKAWHLPGGHKHGMNFAFAAADAGARQGEETRLIIRAVDPRKDRDRLEILAADPAVHQALSARPGKFALPDGVLVAEGTERVVLPRPMVVVRNPRDLRSMPRIGHLGPLSNQAAARLLPQGTKVMDAKKPLALTMVPGEMRQIIVHVVPGKGAGFYAVAVDHVGKKDRVIGGLMMIFIPPPELF